jgi:hypothetical protein
MVREEGFELLGADITITDFSYTYTEEQVQHLQTIHSVSGVRYHLDLNGMYLFCSKKCEILYC